jgi:hypothetical protein
MELEFIRPEVEAAYKCMFLPRSSKWVGKAKKLNTPGETVTVYEDTDIYYVTLLNKKPEKTYQFGVYTAQSVHLLSPKFMIHDGMPFYSDQETNNTICILRIIKDLVNEWRSVRYILDRFTREKIERDELCEDEVYADEVLLTKLDSGLFVLDAITPFLKTYRSAEFSVLPQKA